MEKVTVNQKNTVRLLESTQVTAYVGKQVPVCPAMCFSPALSAAQETTQGQNGQEAEGLSKSKIGTTEPKLAK